MEFPTPCCCILMRGDTYFLSVQPWPHVTLFISHHPLLSPLSTISKNAIKFLIHLSCEEWNSQVARGHIHSLSSSTPEEELDRGLPSAHHVTLNKSRWLSDKHSHVRTLYFPGNPKASPPIQFSRCKSWNVVLRKIKTSLSLSLSPSIFLPLPCKQY